MYDTDDWYVYTHTDQSQNRSTEPENYIQAANNIYLGIESVLIDVDVRRVQQLQVSSRQDGIAEELKSRKKAAYWLVGKFSFQTTGSMHGFRARKAYILKIFISLLQFAAASVHGDKRAFHSRPTYVEEMGALFNSRHLILSYYYHTVASTLSKYRQTVKVSCLHCLRGVASIRRMHYCHQGCRYHVWGLHIEWWSFFCLDFGVII